MEIQRELKECLEHLLSETDLTTDSINKAVTKKTKGNFSQVLRAAPLDTARRPFLDPEFLH